MHYFKGFVALTISLLIFGDAAIAQNTEKYFEVGQDSSGDPFFLDTTTMGKVEPGYGSVILVYQLKSGYMKEMIFKPSCSEKRLSILGIRYFDQNGTQVSEEKQEQDFPIQAGSTASKTMQYYCHAISASGW